MLHLSYITIIIHIVMLTSLYKVSVHICKYRSKSLIFLGSHRDFFKMKRTNKSVSPFVMFVTVFLVLLSYAQLLHNLAFPRVLEYIKLPFLGKGNRIRLIAKWKCRYAQLVQMGRYGHTRPHLKIYQKDMSLMLVQQPMLEIV